MKSKLVDLVKQVQGGDSKGAIAGLKVLLESRGIKYHLEDEPSYIECTSYNPSPEELQLIRDVVDLAYHHSIHVFNCDPDPTLLDLR